MNLADASDAELVSLCTRGRQDAWSTLVRRYQRLVYTVARRARLPEATADDIFQATFVRLYEHLDRLADPARVRAWLVTTARRLTLDALEQQRREQRHSVLAGGGEGPDGDDGVSAGLEVVDPDPLPEEQLAQWQELDLVRRAVDRLEPRLRQFAEVVFLHDPPLRYDEMAQRLGMAEGSIGPTRARCLARLRAELQRLM